MYIHRVTRFVCLYVVGIKRSSWFVFGTVRGFRPSRLRVHWRSLRSRWSSAQRRPTLTWSNRWVKGSYSLRCVTRFMKAMLCQAHSIVVTALASAPDCSLILWDTFWLKSKSPVFDYYADYKRVMCTSFQVARLSTSVEELINGVNCLGPTLY